ncbi:hypothetical protein HHI36_009694 [Cryptolaemus montrouzieri]|uniref:Uncharacterized protein n=1 Tax=Cryptolaemus montrouzieri TaxID=559131 RepID=A0ABD2MGJ8_9CUCU
MVQVNIPEVVPCKYPDSYTSFETTINEDSFDKAKDVNVRPKGALIKKFFNKYSKKQNSDSIQFFDKKKSNFSVFYLNLQGLGSKANALEIFLMDNNSPDIVCFTEHILR